MKTKAITISRKRDPDENPSLVMDRIKIAENETLEVLGFTIDSKEHGQHILTEQ